jgi:hypothetical protein
VNSALVRQRVQRKQFSRAPMLIADALGALQDGWRHRTATAVEWSIRPKPDVEKYRQRSLGVADGQSNVADRGTRLTLPSSGEEVKPIPPARLRLLFCGHEGSAPRRS